MQAATPAGGEPREQPGLLSVRTVASTLLLARSTITRKLQSNILDKMPPEGGPAGLLDVEKHNHVFPLDFEIYVAHEIFNREVVLFHIVRIRSGENGHVLFTEKVPLRGAEVYHPGRHVLVQNQHEEDRSDDDQQKFTGPFNHVPFRVVHLLSFLRQQQSAVLLWCLAPFSSLRRQIITGPLKSSESGDSACLDTLYPHFDLSKIQLESVDGTLTAEQSSNLELLSLL